MIASSMSIRACRAVDVLKKDGAAPLPRDLDGLQKTLERLQESLTRAHAYVEEVAVCLTSLTQCDTMPSCALSSRCPLIF